MKAVVCREYGGPELASFEDIDPPELKPGQVRIRVEACSASFASLLVMAGKHQNRAPLPLVAGTEIAGTVVEVDHEVDRFKPGDRVIAGVQTGAYAQEACCPVETVFALPDAIDFDTGAQFPTIYGTAYGSLKWRAQLQPGEVVLVHGAAGGSGLAAVEVAKALGAAVIATVGSDEKAAAVTGQGADHVINYRTSDFREAVLRLTDGRGADVVYDPVGGEMFEQSMRCIAPEGRIIPMGFAGGTIPTIPANIVLVKNISVLGVYWGYYFDWAKQKTRPGNDARMRAAYAELFRWVMERKIRPLKPRTFALSDFREALELIEQRKAIGRVVMRPQ